MRIGARQLRWVTRAAAIAGGVCVLAAIAQGSPAASAPSVQSRIDRVLRSALARHGIRAVIFQATVNGRVIMTRAYGSSMTGVPATANMHFRNGAVEISYMATLLLRLVDEGKARLSDRVSKWLPHLRDAGRVTLGELARMTAGYHDFEVDPKLTQMVYSNPFGVVTTRDQLRLMLDRPLQFTPGTNWSYSHSDYVVLGLALEKITKLPLNVALSRMVLRPLGLRGTVASQTAAIPPPVLHAFSPERKMFLGIPASAPFDEETTFWNPSWSLARGAVETTDIVDMTRTAVGIGTGHLLSRRAYREMIDPHVGFGHPDPPGPGHLGCERCRTLSRLYGYGVGIVVNGSWLLQNPLFAGYGAIESYLPSKRISIALAVTFEPSSYDYEGNPSSWWTTGLYAQIGRILAPRDPPLTR